MKQHIFLTAIVVAIVCTMAVAAPPSVQQTSFDRPTPGDATPRPVAPQTVRFSAAPSHVGDQMEQNVSLEMRLTLNMHRAGNLLGKEMSTVRTKQRRVVTSTAAEGDRATAVRVAYVEATKQVITDKQPLADANAVPAASSNEPVAEPVQGKAYLCHREPGENGKLIVTDEAGNQPPSEELEIVSQQMDLVGRPNPLAKFLAGRIVTVGERLDVPVPIARQIFNWGEKFGQITRFTLTLREVQTKDGAQLAVFTTNVDAESHNASQLRLEVEGPLVVQVDTCRATQTGLIGPIGMSQTRGTYNTAYQVVSTGRVQVNIASTYRTAR